VSCTRGTRKDGVQIVNEEGKENKDGVCCERDDERRKDAKFVEDDSAMIYCVEGYADVCVKKKQ
jgi:hypothetical protein